jgi:hypothetical protein
MLINRSLDCQHGFITLIHAFTFHKSINIEYLIIFSHCDNKSHGSNKSHMISDKKL